MAQTGNRRSAKGGLFDPDGIHAAMVVVWTISIWCAAFLFVRDAAADESAGVGGSSFLLAGAFATACVLTAFSVRKFLGAYRRWRGRAAHDRVAQIRFSNSTVRRLIHD